MRASKICRRSSLKRMSRRVLHSNSTLFPAVAASLVLALSTAAGAGVSINGPWDARETLETSAAIERVAPPLSVRAGELIDAESLRIFPERREHDLIERIAADITQPGVVASGSDLSPGTIAAGTRVTAFLIHGDMGVLSRDSRASGILEGSVTFSAPVLAVIVTGPSLSGSDQSVGAPQTEYPGDSEEASSRGMELDGSDQIELSQDRMTLRFRLDINSDVDEIRVITAPLPGSEIESPVMIGGGVGFDTGLTGWLFPTPPPRPLPSMNGSPFQGTDGVGGASGLPTIPDLLADDTPDETPDADDKADDPMDPTKDPKPDPDKPTVDLPPNKDETPTPPVDPLVPAPGGLLALTFAAGAGLTRRRR